MNYRDLPKLRYYMAPAGPHFLFAKLNEKEVLSLASNPGLVGVEWIDVAREVWPVALSFYSIQRADPIQLGELPEKNFFELGLNVYFKYHGGMVRITKNQVDQIHPFPDFASVRPIELLTLEFENAR